MNLNSIDILRQILSDSAEAMLIFSYQTSRHVQSKIDMQEKNTSVLFDKAFEMKTVFRLPFWDSLMTSTFFVPDFDNQVFIEALSHTENSYYTEINCGNIDYFASTLDNIDENLAAASNVKVKEGVNMHICMIDFNIPFSTNGTYVITQLLKTLKIQGYLLCSGKSYHFYGKRLMLEEEYIQFLVKLIFLSPIIDKNWIAHQLLRSQSFLRITKKYGHFPYLVETID